MKKFMLLAMIALGALGIIGCAEDETKADMKWTNTTSNSNPVIDIAWVKSSKVDQTWGGTYNNDGASTSSKGITELVGYGECFVGTTPSDIEINPSSDGVSSSDGFSTTIVENSAANLEIVDAQAK